MSKYEFLGQSKKEEVIFVAKRHCWFFSKPLIKILALLLILLVLFYFFGASAITSYSLVIFIILFVYIFSLNFFRWSNSNYLLTNQRVICVEQASWFERTVSEANLQNILFISHRIHGFIPTFLNIGSIHIRASGVTEEEIIMEGIAEPYEYQQKIAEAQKKYTGVEPETARESKEFWKKEKR